MKTHFVKTGFVDACGYRSMRTETRLASPPAVERFEHNASVLVTDDTAYVDGDLYLATSHRQFERLTKQMKDKKWEHQIITVKPENADTVGLLTFLTTTGVHIPRKIRLRPRALDSRR